MCKYANPDLAPKVPQLNILVSPENPTLHWWLAVVNTLTGVIELIASEYILKTLPWTIKKCQK